MQRIQMQFARWLMLASLMTWSAAALAQPSPVPSATFDPDTVLVKFEPGTPGSARSQAHAASNGRVEREIPGLAVAVVHVGAGNVERALGAYGRNPNVRYVERNVRRTVFLPSSIEGSEPGIGIGNNFNEQWGLHNAGQAFGATLDPLFGQVVYPSYRGVADADINAPEAWQLSTGSSSVTIAILDTGVACSHLDLVGKCIDEQNFVAHHAGSPLDDLIGHGTHLAGIAAATTDNGVGIAGVAPEARIAALKVCFENTDLAIFGIVYGQCDDADVAAAIMYAIDQGYSVINMSFAGPDPTDTLKDAVDAAWTAGIVLTAAAGNGYEDSSQFPAAYGSVIGVGSTDFADNLSAFSNYGSGVSVLAPGTAIVSTVPGGMCGQSPSAASDCYDTQSGTSMASPHVAGLAGLLFAHVPGIDNAAVRDAIERHADIDGALGQNMQAWSTFGRIDLEASLLGAVGGGGGGDPSTLGVGSIALSTINEGKGRKSGRALVTVVDNLGDPVQGVAVTGSFSGAFSGPDLPLTTDAAGQVDFSSNNSRKGGVSFGFCVSDITGGLLFNDALANDCAAF